MVGDPHIIPLYDADEAGGILFIAMGLVPGRSDVRWDRVPVHASQP
jgi:hypothetical protein